MGAPGPSLLLLLLLRQAAGLLFPRDSPSRESKSLDGMWNFKATPGLNQQLGFNQSWFSGLLVGTIAMPVPASYNDITVEASLRDFVGWAWYDRTFYVSPSWKEKRILLR